MTVGAVQQSVVRASSSALDRLTFDLSLHCSKYFHQVTVILDSIKYSGSRSQTSPLNLSPSTILISRMWVSIKARKWPSQNIGLRETAPLLASTKVVKHFHFQADDLLYVTFHNYSMYNSALAFFKTWGICLDLLIIP